MRDNRSERSQAAARKAFLAEEHARKAKRGVSDETERPSSLHAKTARLKDLREAGNAAARKRGAAKARPKKGGK